jgi:hypothetical protein
MSQLIIMLGLKEYFLEWENVPCLSPVFLNKYTEFHSAKLWLEYTCINYYHSAEQT